MLSLVAVGDIFLAAMSINVRKRAALTLKLGERTSISVIFLARPLAATMELDWRAESAAMQARICVMRWGRLTLLGFLVDIVLAVEKVDC